MRSKTPLALTAMCSSEMHAGNGSGVQAAYASTAKVAMERIVPFSTAGTTCGTARYPDGEAIVSSDPPQGVVDANLYPNFDRFTVTFDANYMMIDDFRSA